MTRKFWTIVVAALFIICLASMADAQSNGNQGNNPGNGNGNQGQHSGNGNQGENPGNGNGSQAENPRNSRRRTPDGETPAEEGTCDELKHGTPGLYGLCIAFCEAHDCDPVYLDDDTLDFSHCKKNDGKLLYKYRDRMREGDPDMPCLPSQSGSGGQPPAGEVTCPCWNEDDLDKFRYPLDYEPSDTTLNDFVFTECDAYDEEIEISDDNSCYQRVDYRKYYQGFATEDWEFPYRYFFELEAGTGACVATGFYCSRLDHCEGSDCSGDFTGFDGVDGISQEDYDACMTELAELDPYCGY